MVSGSGPLYRLLAVSGFEFQPRIQSFWSCMCPFPFPCSFSSPMEKMLISACSRSPHSSWTTMGLLYTAVGEDARSESRPAIEVVQVSPERFQSMQERPRKSTEPTLWTRGGEHSQASSTISPSALMQQKSSSRAAPCSTWPLGPS